MGENIFCFFQGNRVLSICCYFVVLRFIKAVYQLLWYTNIFRFSNKGISFGEYYLPTYVVGSVCALHKLAGYRWHHVPTDGRYSQQRDDLWLCATQKLAKWLTASLTRWQITPTVLVPQRQPGRRLNDRVQFQSTRGNKDSWRRKRRGRRAMHGCSVPCNRRGSCGLWWMIHRWQRKANLRWSRITW